MAIARAIGNRPDYPLTDEPTANLDSRTSLEMLNLFRTLNNEGQTVVMVTHNLRELRLLRPDHLPAGRPSGGGILAGRDFLTPVSRGVY